MKPWWILVLPFFMIFVVSWLPAINGPHLWLGLPSLMVWILFWTLSVTVVLLLYRRWTGGIEE